MESHIEIRFTVQKNIADKMHKLFCTDKYWHLVKYDNDVIWFPDIDTLHEFLTDLKIT